MGISLPISSEALLNLLEVLHSGTMKAKTVEKCQLVAEAAGVLCVDIEHLEIVDEKPMRVCTKLYSDRVDCAQARLKSLKFDLASVRPTEPSCLAL